MIVSRQPRVLIGYSTCPHTLEAFLSNGVNAHTCDILPSRGNPERHFQMDIWEALTKTLDWDFAVLHPMCTYLTCSGAWAFNDPDFTRYPGKGYHQMPNPDTLTGLARREARSQALENFRRLLDLPFPVAIENPAISFINKAIRPPDQVVHPYHFGDDASKATGFWLTKNTPPLVHGEIIPPRRVIYRGKEVERWANQAPCGAQKLPPSKDRWLLRSATYPGIAAAMGEQWGRWLVASLNQLRHLGRSSRNH